MARWCGPAERFFYALAAPWHFSRAAIFVSGGHLVRPGHGKAAAQGGLAAKNCRQHHPSRGGNLWLWPAVPSTGVRDRVGLGPEKRPVPRGYPEHHWTLDDVDGSSVLDRPGRGIWRGRPRARTADSLRYRVQSSHPLGPGADCDHDRAPHLVFDSAALDDMAATLAALAARVLY